MGEQAPRGTLYVVVCAAPPAAHVQDLVKLAQAAGWEVAVTATPEALAFIDAPLLEAITGFPVRHRWREPDEPESVPEANAIVVAPATFNTINRWVAGITNTVAVGTLCESLGLDAPIVAVPNVNPPLARHPTFRTSLRQLREWGVRVLFEESALERLACPRGRRSSRRSTRRTRPPGGHPEELRGQAPRRGSMEGRRDPARGVHVGRRAHRHLPSPAWPVPTRPGQHDRPVGSMAEPGRAWHPPRRPGVGAHQARAGPEGHGRGPDRPAVVAGAQRRHRVPRDPRAAGGIDRL